jgi:hypothetical protein
VRRGQEGRFPQSGARLSLSVSVCYVFVMRILHRLLPSALLLGLSTVAFARPNPTVSQGVHVELEAPRQTGSLFHWKIKNTLQTAVYVYDFYLWGPALHVGVRADRVVFETAPIAEVRSCPPIRFPPVLLLVIGPGRSIEGDFVNAAVRDLEGKPVSLQVAVGTEPYSVVSEAARYYNSNCEHNPYDAIVRWGTLVESSPARLGASGDKRPTPKTVTRGRQEVMIGFVSGHGLSRADNTEGGGL